MKNFLFKDKHGLLARITTYKHANRDFPSVKLHPMLHIGEKEFYEEIYWEERHCDTVLLEGVGGRTGSIAGRLHKLTSRMPGLALMSQTQWFQSKKSKSNEWSRDNEHSPWEFTIIAGPRNGVECIPKRVRFVRADLDDIAAHKITRQWPLAMWFLLFMAPTLFWVFCGKMNRKDLIETLAKNSDLEFPSGFAADYFERFFEFARDDRDEYLAALLRTEIRPRNKKHLVGITYGAAHMNKLHRLLLDEFGYKVAEERDVRVICARPDYIGSESDGYGIANAAFLQMMGLEFKPTVSKHWLTPDEKVSRPHLKKIPSVNWLNPEIWPSNVSLDSHAFKYSFEAYKPTYEWRQNVQAS